MVKQPFLQEHLEEGIVIKTMSTKPCLVCRALTEMYDPYSKAQVCSLSCYNYIQETIDRARMNNGI